jgi:23S rRNA (uracil1939-C5)-methyltransferase
VNEEAALALRAHVLERCVASGSSTGSLTAVDAYCGAGVYGLALAAEGWSVRGIESDPTASGQARVNSDAALSKATASSGSFAVHEGRVESLLPTLLPADLLVLNPPRSGLQEDVPKHVLERPPARIVYVSCDPATLARDLKRLSDRYTLDGVRAFDLFPQTAHVETVAELSLRSTSQ